MILMAVRFDPTRWTMRGLTFVGLVILLMGGLGIWAAVQFAQGYFMSIQIEQTMTEVVLRKKNEWVDAVLSESICSEVKSKHGVDLDSRELSFLHSSDGQKIEVKVPYRRVISIPFSDQNWVLRFEARIEEQRLRGGSEH